MQSFDDEELDRLGPDALGRRARGEAVGAARAAGFDNLSLDLMLWLPGQSLGVVAADGRTRPSTLAPDHLSLYLLELYPNAPLKEAMARAPGRWLRALGAGADDEAADMYLDGARARSIAAGFEQYEISNVAQARPREPAQPQVLAERRLARIRLRSAFDGRTAGAGATSAAPSTTCDRVWAAASPCASTIAPLSPAIAGRGGAVYRPATVRRN